VSARRLIAFVAALAACSGEVFSAETNVQLIVDSSGSMAAKMGGRLKMDIAKEVLASLVKDLSPDARLALRAYGHRSKTDCEDIELLASFGAIDRAAMAARINALKPLGKTPIARSLELAGKDFEGTGDSRNIVILVSDGEETCVGDPCAVARKLRQSGIELQTNVVGFDVKGKERDQLQCIAEAGGGKYYDAADAAKLALAATEVRAQIAQATPTPTPAATATPTPTPDPRFNLLAEKNGGQLLVAPKQLWARTIDGKEEAATWFYAGEEAVYGFKDEAPASFDTFASLVAATESNAKELELLVADDSPTGSFRSIGTFELKNVKLMKTPYQEFKFEPVTAKYLKVKIVSSYETDKSCLLREFRLFGKLESGGGSASASTRKPTAGEIDLLAAGNGGQILVAPYERWAKTIDGSTDAATWFYAGEEAVFGFKNEAPATFSRFLYSVEDSQNNAKEIELLVGDDSPTGDFRSVGTMQVQNVKLMKTPFQEFAFEPVTAKYLKVKIISTYSNDKSCALREIKLMGKLDAGSGTAATASSPPAGVNLLSTSQGGQLLSAPKDNWARTIDGKEEQITWFYSGEEAVVAFKDEKPATFNAFAAYVAQTGNNPKEIELLVSDDLSDFRSIGTFEVKDVRMMPSPYQKFSFPETTAKYLKVKLVSSYSADKSCALYEFQLWGKPDGR
jgi:hypothetical protein